MDYDVLADEEVQENIERRQYLRDLSEVLGTEAGQNVAVEMLERLGMGKPILCEAHQFTYNEALRLFRDMQEARSEAARKVLARVMS